MKRIAILSLVMLVVFSAFVIIKSTNQVQATVSTQVSGIISTNTTWNTTYSPYVITETIQIPEGVTLTIDAGVTIIKPTAGDMFLLNGNITAHGNISNRIIFDGGENSNFFSAKSSTIETFLDLDYCTIRNGQSLWWSTGYGYLSLRNSEIINLTNYSYIWYPGNNVYIEYNTIRNSSGFSIGHNNDVKVYFSNNLFESNNLNSCDDCNFCIENWASYDTSRTIIINNSFIQINGTVLRLPPGYKNAAMTAVNNYWGTLDTNLIDTMIFDKNDDITCAGYINYTPILTEPSNGTPESTDSDGDGLPNSWEVFFELDPYNPYDALLDQDGDGLTNSVEFEIGTDPNSKDSDGDGLPDSWEVQAGLDPIYPNDAETDSDSDGLIDTMEFEIGTDPNSKDSDGDGLPDSWEVQAGLDPINPSDAGTDPDGDGLTNIMEFNLGTDPNNYDTDGDGLTDEEELALGTDPNDDDSDADGFTDKEEVDTGYDPLDSSSVPGYKIDDDDLAPSIDDQIISDAIESGDIFAAMSIDEDGNTKTNYYLDNIEMELLNIDQNHIEFIVSGEAEQGKVVALNIDSDNEFKISDSGNLVVKLDGENIVTAFYTTVLSAQGNDGMYCISVSSDGTQILVYIPHFSEHTISIEKITEPEKSDESFSILWIILVIVIMGTLWVLSMVVMNNRLKKRADEIPSYDIDDNQIEERYRETDDPSGFQRQRRKSEPLEYRGSVRAESGPRRDEIQDDYDNQYDELYGEETNNDEQDDDNFYLNSHYHKSRCLEAPCILEKSDTRKTNKEIKRIKKDFSKHIQSDHPDIPNKDIKILLEAKHRQGEISKEIYTYIQEDLRNID